MSSAAAAPPRPDMARASDLPPPPPPPPLLTATSRRPRPRNREVSSRYLSTPVASSSPRHSTASSSSSSRSRSPSPTPSRRAATPFANENHPPTTVSRTPRAVQKLFGEATNASAAAAACGNLLRSSVSAATPRPGRQLPRSCSGPAPSTARRGYPRPPTPARASSCPSAAADDAASCCSSDAASTVTDSSDPDGISLAAAPAPCESPPLLGPASCRGGRLSSELRASVPESGGSARSSNSLCYRSLNSALSTCPAPTGKVIHAARPPQPHGPKAAELKKAAIVAGRKVVGKTEDVHSLRLLDNCYVQYRFLNARAAATAKAKNTQAEESLYGLAEKIVGMRESVATKKAEVERIKREQRLCAIVDAQLPYLDEWCGMEADHSSCLTGVTSSLHDASLRLPVVGNVKANSEEIKEALNSAVQLLEPLSPCIENFLLKVEQIDDTASNLAQVIAGERSLIEECGNLLNQAHHMQMREYSLRSQLMQMKEVKET